MLDYFSEHPERLTTIYVVAAMLPLLPAVLMLLVGAAKNLARSAVGTSRFSASVYRVLGGERPQVWGAYLSIACVATSAVLAIIGVTPFVQWDERAELDKTLQKPFSMGPGGFYGRLAYPPAFGDSFDWLRFGSSADADKTLALQIDLYIDTLAAIMFAMVTVISTLIFVFSLGYMRDERETTVDDHEPHVHRRGRIGRFYVYLSMFVSAMLNLLIAGNLFQIFVCWELVGVCSFLLISFYYERGYAGIAANKAFIMNRIGDAGFLIGIAIAWHTYGKLTIYDLSHTGGYYPDWWAIMGLGIFLGCIGKSAQFPLQTWLPDAMAGPTPVSALIHAATMVAAGVYLVARCYPLFNDDVQLIIPYVGCVTLFLAATAACVQTDIKKVLAYSTISQLGFMMLALGVGGWVAGVFHLLTHAFFKALLFLGAGSVIYGLHHEQDLRKMGGLWRKMPITAITMLIAVLAIGGFPLLSGWYSKGLVLTSAWEFVHEHPKHGALFVIPLITAGLTAFYMVRMWILAFAGEARDHKIHEHVHESPRVMTTPLLILAMCTIVIGWGWPIWSADHSVLVQLLKPAAPDLHIRGPWDEPFEKSTHRDAPDEAWERIAKAAFGGSAPAAPIPADHSHLYVELAAGAAMLLGFALAWALYIRRTPRFPAAGEPRGFLARAWYFDEIYAALVKWPTMSLAFLAAATDKRPGSSDGHGSDPDAKRVDVGTLDGVLSSVGQVTALLGGVVRRFQTGRIRVYVLVLGLTVVGLLMIL